MPPDPAIEEFPPSKPFDEESHFSVIESLNGFLDKMTGLTPGWLHLRKSLESRNCSDVACPACLQIRFSRLNRN